MPSLRTLLILSRASNLPTVWSNCLAAWWLGGGGSLWTLPPLLLGASLLYIGGMFMNDAVDVEFDRQHRTERPIPSGQIAEKLVWRISFGLLGLGALALVALSALSAPPRTVLLPTPPGTSNVVSSHQALTRLELHARSNLSDLSATVATNSPLPETNSTNSLPSIANSNQRKAFARHAIGLRSPFLTALLALALLALIAVYDLTHKLIAFSPLLMGGCRTLLFLVAASIAKEGLTGLSVWSGLALGTYVAGFSYFARVERMLRRPEWWPCLLLAVPIVLAAIVNNGSYREDSILISLILGLWILRSLRSAIGNAQRNVPRSVAALIAGIVFVDLLAVCGAPKEFSVLFLILFGATLLFQRFVPAT